MTSEVDHGTGGRPPERHARGPSRGRSALLARHGSGEGDRIGGGHEAEVYRLGPDRVLKLFEPHVAAATVASRRRLYAGLDASRVTFAVPRVLDAGQEDGTLYAVEARIPGSSLADMLPRLDEAARRAALLAYAEASTAIAEVGLPPQPFGEAVAVPPLLAGSWANFAAARAEASLRSSFGKLEASVDRPGRALARLEGWLARRPVPVPRLVHGDYHPANVMVDATGRVTGVIDFGPLTLAGDPRLDVACALLFLAGLDGITARDREVVAAHLRGRGLRDEDLELYGLFYAFRLLDTEREGLFRWCARTIQAAC